MCPAHGRVHQEQEQQQAAPEEGAGEGGPHPGVAQEVAAVAELLTLSAHHVVLALYVEDFVLGGAAASRHFTF